jgi:Uma2 family endonuclease
MSERVIASPIIEYPESDGKPVGETDVHRREILHTIETLERHFRDAPDIYVSGNLMFYYEEGNPAAVVSPDVFVVKGVRKGLRRTYKLWDEGVAPCVVIEMTSRSTRLEDKGNKRALYAQLGVREYFLFDPQRLLGEEALRCYELRGRTYAPCAESWLGDIGLGVRLWDGEYEGVKAVWLRWCDQEGNVIPTGAELAEAERARAEAERQRAEEEQRRAEAERARAERLAARLRALGIDPDEGVTHQ